MADETVLAVQGLYGPTLIGLFLGLIVYGVTLSQFFFYFTTFHSEDGKGIQIWVASLAILETSFMITSLAYIYRVLVTDFGHVPIPRPKSLLTFAYFSLAGIMIAVVHAFFAWRIYVLIESRWILCFLIVAAFVSSGLGITCGVLTGLVIPGYSRSKYLLITGILWNICVTMCDVSISGTLTWYLYRKRTELSLESDSIVNNIMKVTIQNGLLITILQIINLSVFLSENGGVYRIVFFFSPILLVSSSLAAMNARDRWRRQQRATPISLDIHFNKPTGATTADLVTMATQADIPISQDGGTTASIANMMETHELDDLDKSKTGDWAGSSSHHSRDTTDPQLYHVKYPSESV